MVNASSKENDMQDFWAEFPAVDTLRWQQAVERLLGGATERLTWQADADWSLRPMYRADEVAAASPLTAAVGAVPLLTESWQLQGDAPALNERILAALAQGVSELIFRLPAAWRQEDLQRALEGVWLDMVRISFDIESADSTDVERLQEFLAERPCCGHIAFRGDWAASFALIERLPAYSAATLRWAAEVGEGQTQAQALARIVEQMQSWLEYAFARGWSWENAVLALRVEVEIGESYLLQVARVRALRRVYLALAESWQAAGRYVGEMLPPLPILATTTSHDTLHKTSTFSLLAATNQALSASIGGIGALQISPPTGWEGLQEAQARRLARNVYHLLLNESYVFHVADPAAGAYYIEKATEQLAQNAWAAAKW